MSRETWQRLVKRGDLTRILPVFGWHIVQLILDERSLR